MAYDVLSDEGYSHRDLSIIDEDGAVRDQMVTDEPLGRTVEEAVRMLNALQYFEKSEEVCQVNLEGEEYQMVTDESLGRTVEEAVRMPDALQYFEKTEEVCQVNFQGEESLEPAGTCEPRLRLREFRT